MPGLGIWEIVFILVLALLIFGPKKLPEIGRTLGRGLGEFRRATNDLKRTFDSEVSHLEREAAEEERSPAPPATLARSGESPAEALPELEDPAPAPVPEASWPAAVDENGAGAEDQGEDRDPEVAAESDQNEAAEDLLGRG